MKLSRGTLVFLIPGVIVLALLIAATIVMINGFGTAGNERRMRDEAEGKLKQYYNKRPFPSEENIEKEKKNLAAVRGWYEDLLRDLQLASINETSRDPVAFNGRREEVTRKLMDKAPTGLDGQKIIPAEFSFGFEDYKEGNRANPDDVQRLFKQLTMTEMLVNEMYASGVAKITKFSRTKFEAAFTAKSEIDDYSYRRGVRGDVAAENPASSKVAGVPVDMDCEKFAIEFESNQNALVTLMNNLSAMKIFAVVTKLEVKKVGNDFVLAPDPAKEKERDRSPGGRRSTGSRIRNIRRAQSEPEPPSADAAPGGVVLNLPPESRTARLVSGQDREAMMQVQLEVQVYSFGKYEPKEGEEIIEADGTQAAPGTAEPAAPADGGKDPGAVTGAAATAAATGGPAGEAAAQPSAKEEEE